MVTKTITGYCQTLKMTNSVDVELLNASAVEDGVKKYIVGRINCCFVKNGLNCNCCSILEAATSTSN